MAQLPSVQEMEAYIREVAVAKGIDPDVAVAVARSEGLAPNTWQANGQLSYGRERSYGPFQLHVAPEGHRGGMGNDFVNDTGLDPSDPSTWKQGVDYALGRASKSGWSPWYGAKKIGVTGMEGIGGNPADYTSGGSAAAGAPPQGHQAASFSAGEYTPAFDYSAPGGLLDPSTDPVTDGASAVAETEDNSFSKYGKAASAFAKAVAPAEKPETAPLTPIIFRTGEYTPLILKKGLLS